MNVGSKPAAFPLLVIEVRRNGRIAMLGVAAAAPVRAHEKLALLAGDVHQLAVGPGDEIPHRPPLRWRLGPVPVSWKGRVREGIDPQNSMPGWARMPAR